MVRSEPLPLEWCDADIGRQGPDRVVLTFPVPRGFVTGFQAPVALGEQLCRVARGVQLPFEGTVSIFGRDTRTFGSDELKRLEHTETAVVAALPQVHEDLGLLDNATLTGRMLGLKPGPLVSTARALFEDAGLTDEMLQRPGRVGVKAVRTMALIRAILPRPSLVVVEPEAIDTDVRLAERSCRVLREYAYETGAGVLWATYSTRLACTADRVWTYSLGRAVDLDA